MNTAGTQNPSVPSALEKDQQEYQKAADCLAKGDQASALAILQRLVEANTECWEVYNDCGAIAVSQGEIETAHDFLTKAVACQKEPGAARIRLALVEHMQKQYEAALSTLSPVLRMDPGNVDALALTREILGAAPILSTVAWARLVADLRMPSPEVRREIGRVQELESECKAMAKEKTSLLERIHELGDELRHSARAGKGSGSGSWDDINVLRDEDWLNVLIRSVEVPSYRGFPLPAFPAESLQVGTVGSSNEAALREGFNFYRTVKAQCQKHGMKLSADMNLLDFGTGWGRYARIFMKDIRPEGILGVDVDSTFVDVCRGTFPYSRFETVPAFPPTELSGNRFNLIIAYSVFSHLSEDAATAWIKEFERILVPGGMIAITTQGRTFLEFCESIRATGKIEHPWHQNLARSFLDLAACEATYDRGEFLFAPTGGGDARPSTFYGEALIPKGFVESHWSEFLEPVEFIDDRKCLPQALIVMRKRG